MRPATSKSITPVEPALVEMIMATALDESVLTTFIVSRPGILQESLRAILLACPSVELIGSAGDGLTALNAVRVKQPSLLVLDSNLVEEEILSLLGEVKKEQLQMRCLVLAETERQQSRMMAAGADAVLLRSDTIDKWRETLAGLGKAE